MKIAYSYDDDGYLMGVQECQRDYFTGEYLTPAHATQVAPPECGKESIPRWDGNAWSLVEDHRGTAYWMPEDEWDAEPRYVTAYGPMPEGFLTVPPNEPTTEQKWALHVKSIYAGMSIETIRQHLYEELRYRFVADDFNRGPDESQPLCLFEGESLTVDEAKQIWVRYYGDDDAKAQMALALSTTGKQYIRQVMAKVEG